MCILIDKYVSAKLLCGDYVIFMNLSRHMTEQQIFTVLRADKNALPKVIVIDVLPSKNQALCKY